MSPRPALVGESKQDREDREAHEELAAKAEMIRVCARMKRREALEFLSDVIGTLAAHTENRGR